MVATFSPFTNATIILLPVLFSHSTCLSIVVPMGKPPNGLFPMMLEGISLRNPWANRAQHFHKRLVDGGPVLLVRVSQHVCRCMHPAVGPPYRRPQRCGCDQGCINDLFYPPEFWYRSPFCSTRCRLSWM